MKRNCAKMARNRGWNGLLDVYTRKLPIKYNSNNAN